MHAGVNGVNGDLKDTTKGSHTELAQWSSSKETAKPNGFPK